MLSCCFKKASSHWVIERLSSILLLPFSLWFVWCALPNMVRTPSEVYAWFQCSFNASAAFMWTLLLFWHGCLGVQVVIEDYISSPHTRQVALVFCRLLSFLAAFCAGCEIILMWGGWI